MNAKKMYNKRLEHINFNGTKQQRRKKYKHIAQEMGMRNITMEDIARGLGDKEKGFLDMVDETGMTMDEVVMLQAYSKAIIDRDIRAAEFIRDTAGDKPSTQIEMTGESNGLSQMTLEELKELKAAIESLKEKE
jgi:hypothetical protein